MMLVRALLKYGNWLTRGRPASLPRRNGYVFALPGTFRAVKFLPVVRLANYFVRTASNDVSCESWSRYKNTGTVAVHTGQLVSIIVNAEVERLRVYYTVQDIITFVCYRTVVYSQGVGVDTEGETVMMMLCS
jgi:hypothetical protein